MPSIILLDDEPAEIHLMARALRERMDDCKIFECWTLADAQAVMAKHNIDVIVCDHHLPDGQGLTLLRELEHLPLRPIFIMMTGLGDEKLAADALSHGADAYVIKALDGRHRQTVANHAADFLERERNTLKQHKLWRFQLPTTSPELPLIMLNHEGGIESCTEGFERLIGGRLERFLNATFLDCLAEVSNSCAAKTLQRIYSKAEVLPLLPQKLEDNDPDQCLAKMRRLDGVLADIQFRQHQLIADSDNAAKVIVIMPALEEQQWARKLANAHTIDSLTALPSREGVNKRWAPSEKPREVLLLALDNLTDINETYGLSDGNTLLRAMSQVVYAAAPNYATCARWSGNQFVVIMTQQSGQPDCMSELLTQLRATLPAAIGNTPIEYHYASTTLEAGEPPLAPHIVALRQQLAPL